MTSQNESEIAYRNKERARRGRLALSAWQDKYGGSSNVRDNLIDLLTDLGHFAVQNNLVLSELYAMAQKHVRAELTGQEEF